MIRLVVLEGLTSYDEAHALQLKSVERRKRGEIPDTLYLLEHPPVITLGRNADPAGIIASSDELEKRGIQTRRIERGGQATYHGPGQIVGYPIIDLDARKMGVRRYVADLEETMIRAVTQFGIRASRRDGMIGVFCERGKLGAVGVRVTEGVAFHGFAVNVNPKLSHYQLIVPCGMTDVPVTSIAASTGVKPSMDQVRNALAETFLEVFG